MDRSLFKHFRKGQNLSASEYNRLVDIVSGIIRSLFPMGFSDSTGFHIRRQVMASIPSGIQWAEVTGSLQYADPDDEDNPEGFDTYRVKFIPTKFEAWALDTVYSEGTKVEYGDELYKAKVGHTASSTNKPGTAGGKAFWEVTTEVEVKGLAMEGDYSTDDLRNWPRWFVVGDIIPLVKRDENWYIWQTLIPGMFEEGEEKKSSIRWNQKEKRMMAVYR